MTPTAALLAATGLHAGFQLVVTTLVYPVLAATPPTAFAGAHDLHSRRIVPLVVIVYAGCAAGCGWVLLAGPRTPATVTACGLTALAAILTAGVAAPLHGRLGANGPSSSLLLRLLITDRARCAAAVSALLAALVSTA